MHKLHKAIFSFPSELDQIKRRQSLLLSYFIISTFPTLIIAFLTCIIFNIIDDFYIYLGLAVLVSYIAEVLLLKRGYLLTAAGLFFTSVWVTAILNTYGTIFPDLQFIGVAFYLTTIVGIGLIFNVRKMSLVAVASVVALEVMHFSSHRPNLLLDNQNLLIIYIYIVISAAIVLYFYLTRKTYEQELLKANEILTNVLNTIPEFVFWKDVNSVYMGCNKSLSSMIGYSDPSGIIGKTDYDMPWNFGDIEDLIAEDKKIMSTGIPKLNQIQHKNFSKELSAWLDVSKLPLKNENGEVIGILGSYTDISERVNIHNKLKESESKYRSLFDNLHVGVYRTSPKLGGEFIHFNPAFMRMLGCKTVEEVLTRKVEDTYENPDERILILDKIVTDKNINNQKVQLKRADGTIFIGLISATAVYDKSGEIQWIDGIVEDYTSKQEAKDALNQIEQQLTKVISSLPVIIWAVDTDGYFTLSQGKGLKELGFDNNEVVGQSLFTLYKDVPQIVGAVKKALTGETLSEFVEIGEIAYQTTYFPLRSANGTISGCFGISIDVTKNVKNERALKATEENYKNLFESANDSILILDPKTFTILDANIKSKEIYGYTQFELVGKRYLELTTRPSMEMEKIHDAGKGEVIAGYECNHTSSSGKSVQMLVNLSYIYFNGKNCVLCINHDITEHNRLTIQISRSQRLETLGKLAGTVAHDLNHILSGLVTYPDLLLLEIEDSNPLKPEIERIKESGLRAAAIVQDLLTLSRGGLSLTKQLNINTVVSEFLNSVEVNEIVRDKIELNLKLNNDLETISFSKIQMFKLMYNLVSNAADSMPEGGKLSITTQNVSFDRIFKAYDDVPPGDYVLLSISDTGMGMSSENLTHIFEPYYTKKVMGRSGSGIGLTIVWNILKENGGYIDVLSIENKGTSFNIYLPFSKNKQIVEEKIKPFGSLNGNGEKILIVDDNSFQRKLYSKILNELNYETTSFSTGEETLECLKSKDFDLIILDIYLDGGIDGIETFRQISKFKQNLKVLFISGYPSDAQLSEAKKIGKMGFLKKPLTVEELGAAIKVELNK